MLIRSFAAAAALLAAAPAMAQGAPELEARVAAYVQPSNAERLRVLTEQLDAAGLPYSLETFEGGNRHTGAMAGTNVVVVLGEGDKDILLTAHYDAVVLSGGAMSHGVVDNAASVVGVIEAARALKGKDLEHRVRVIFFDQEELGLIGARKWIEAHGLANVAAVVNSDVAAYGDTLMYGQNNGAQSAFVTRTVQELCAERAMQCVGFPAYPPSDDRVFSGAGLSAADAAALTGRVPTVSLGFQDEVGAHQMWLAFNGGAANGLAEDFTPQVFRVIHSPTDTMEHVEGETVRTAGEVYAALIEKLDARLQ